MSKPKPFARLRAKFVEVGWTYDYVALLLGRSVVHVTRCMNAKVPFNQDEQYKLMDELEIPYEEMHEYFPKNGYPQAQSWKYGGFREKAGAAIK